MSAEELWHRRYGHLNQHDLVQLHKKSMVEGILELTSKQVII